MRLPIALRNLVWFVPLAVLAGLAWPTGGTAEETGRSTAVPRDAGKLIVHEWGTFLSVQGSDGVSVGGMVDSEETLPLFVRERELFGRNRACWNSKMETPVTYFYVDQPRKVKVRVGMNKGLLTHWYPAVQQFGPPKDDKAKAPPSESYLDWGQIELIPQKSDSFVGPPAPNYGFKPVEKDSTWRFARETDSALVRIDGSDRKNLVAPVRPEGEYEKFLFYRGLGSLELPLAVRSADSGQEASLTLHNGGSDALKGLVAIRIDRDTIQFAKLADLAGGASREEHTSLIFSAPLPLKEGVPQVKEAVAAGLVWAGLYPKEAQAMVNTWEKSYFRTEGLRILYVLPRRNVDAVIPIKVEPAPDELERIMVGRVEILTPARERNIESAVVDLSSSDETIRKSAQATLDRLGRFREPVLRRIAARTEAVPVKARVESLLAAPPK